MRRLFSLTAATVLASLIHSTSTLQITPTPAPSKTPEPETTLTVTEDTDANTENLPPTQEPFTQSDLAVLAGNVQRPNGAAWHNDLLFVICTGDWTVYQIDSRTSSTVTYIYGVRNGFTLYVEAVSETEVILWIPDHDQNSLLSVNRVRAPQVIASNLQGPWGIAYVDQDRFLITNLTGNNIVAVTRTGDVTELLSDLRSPTGIALDNEYVYFANNRSARRSIEWVERDSLLNGDFPEPQPLVTGLQNTTNILLGPDGYLYIAYSLGTRGLIGRVDPLACIEQGGCSNNEVEIIIFSDLSAPLGGLTISDDMRLFMHTIYRPEIYWVELEQDE